MLLSARVGGAEGVLAGEGLSVNAFAAAAFLARWGRSGSNAAVALVRVGRRSSRDAIEEFFLLNLANRAKPARSCKAENEDKFHVREVCLRFRTSEGAAGEASSTKHLWHSHTARAAGRVRRRENASIRISSRPVAAASKRDATLASKRSALWAPLQLASATQ